MEVNAFIRRRKVYVGMKCNQLRFCIQFCYERMNLCRTRSKMGWYDSSSSQEKKTLIQLHVNSVV